MRTLALVHLFALPVLFAPTLFGQHLEFAATFGGSDQSRGCLLGYGCATSTVTNIAVDAAGNLYLAGNAVGVFSFVNPIEQFPTLGCDIDCKIQVPFVLKTDPTGQNVIYSTFVGTSGLYVALAIDSLGNAWVTSGDPNYFLIKLDPKGNLQFSMKAAAYGTPTDIAVDPSGAIYVTGVYRGSAGCVPNEARCYGQDPLLDLPRPRR